MASMAVPAITLAARMVALWAISDLPWATTCQECPGVPEAQVAVLTYAVGQTQLTSPTSVEPGMAVSSGT